MAWVCLCRPRIADRDRRRGASAQTEPPSVTTDAATAVAQTSATLNGSVTPFDAKISLCEFFWGITVNGGTSFSNSTPCAQTVPSGSTPVAVSADLSGLSPNSTYTFYLYVQYPCDEPTPCAAGANELTVTTLPNPPTVVTSAASGVSGTAAALNGTVNPNGGLVSSCLFQWGKTADYGNSVACASLPGSRTSAVAMSAMLSGLSPDTTYHYRVMATNAGGTSDGTDQTFTTSTSPPPGPTVSGVSPSSGPAGGGTVVDVTGANLAGATEVEFGSTPAASYTVESDSVIVATSPAGSGTVDVTVTTTGGTSSTNTGDQFTYTTVVVSTSASPAVIVSSPTVESSSGAAFSGSVNPEGSATTAYFEYGIDLSDRAPGSSTELYDAMTPVQQVGADSSNHPVSASVAGLARTRSITCGWWR